MTFFENSNAILGMHSGNGRQNRSTFQKWRQVRIFLGSISSNNPGRGLTIFQRFRGAILFERRSPRPGLY